MAGVAAGPRWIRADALIALLQSVPAETLCRAGSVTGGLALYRGDDPEPTWDGRLGYVDFLGEFASINPVTPDDEWPAVRDSPIVRSLDETIAHGR